MSASNDHMHAVRPVRATFIWADGSHPLCAIHAATRCSATGESHTLWSQVDQAGGPCAMCEAERELREVVDA